MGNKKTFEEKCKKKRNKNEPKQIFSNFLFKYSLDNFVVHCKDPQINLKNKRSYCQSHLTFRDSGLLEIVLFL